MSLKTAVIFVIILFITGCAGESSGTAKNSRNYTDQLRYDGEVAIDISNINGFITLRAVSRSEVITIDAVISASASNDRESQSFLDEIDIVFRRQEDYLKVETVVPRQWLMSGKTRKPSGFNVDMVIEIPDGLSVECNNTNGEMQITGPHYDVVAKQENGNISILGSFGKVHATSVNGEIGVQNYQEHNFNVQMITQSGNLSLDLPKAQKGKVNMRTLRGNIELIMNESYEPDISLTTTLGDIDMKLGQRLVATVELKTDGGSINSGIFINTNTEGGTMEDDYIKGMIGSGVGKIDAESKKGNIRMNYYEE